MFITGYNQISIAGYCASNNMIVIGVVWNHPLHGFGLYDYGALCDLFEVGDDCGIICLGFGAQYMTELIHDERRNDGEEYRAARLLRDPGNNPVGTQEGADVEIGIQDNLVFPSPAISYPHTFPQ